MGYDVYRFLWEYIGVEPEHLKPEMSLADLDQDDIDVMELACIFEDEHDVKVDDKWITEETTVKELAEYLEGLLVKAGE